LMTCVLLTNAVSVGATNIFVADSSDFAADNLLYVMGTTNEFVRVSSISGNKIYLTGTTIAAHAISNGVSRVREFGGFSLYDSTSAKTYWGTVSSTVSTNVALKLDMIYTK